MESMVNLIVGGANGYSPDVLVRLFVFVLLLDMLGSVISAMFKAGGVR